MKATGEKLISHLKEEEILKLSNDLSECIASGTVKDWRAVALYFRNQLDQATAELNRVQCSVATLVLGRNCMEHSCAELSRWLEEKRK